MIARWQDLHRTAAGFTLLELLVVLAIMAVLAALVLPSLTAPSDGLRLRTAAEQIAAALRLGRANAIARNAEVVVVVDAERRSIHRTDAPVQELPSDVFIQLTIAESERTTPTRGGFRFFSDGSSTGGDILLRLRGQERRLCVDWLTGKAGQGVEC